MKIIIIAHLVSAALLLIGGIVSVCVGNNWGGAGLVIVGVYVLGRLVPKRQGGLDDQSDSADWWKRVGLN